MWSTSWSPPLTYFHVLSSIYISPTFVVLVILSLLIIISSFLPSQIHLHIRITATSNFSCAFFTAHVSACTSLLVTVVYEPYFQDKVRVRVARIFNTFGPRMHMNDGRVVSNFIIQSLQGDPITVSIIIIIIINGLYSR